MSKRERRLLEVLEVLNASQTPMSSRQIADALTAGGRDISERTVRIYLKEADEQKLIQTRGRRGRTLTTKGLDELRSHQLLRRVGFLSAAIDRMTYLMDFDLPSRSGQVVVNVSCVDPEVFRTCLKEVSAVFAKGFAMGHRVALVPPDTVMGEVVVPEGKVGFCTICSISLNGILLKHGIPVYSRFGGLLELRNGKPRRFAEMINYDGTSIDPLEVFIRSGMADYRGAIRNGNGRIGASFREVPAEARPNLIKIADQCNRIGLGAFLVIGHSGRPVLDIPVSEGRIGLVIIGGLNPISILEENGYRVESRALSSLMPYEQLFHYTKLSEELRKVTA